MKKFSLTFFLALLLLMQSNLYSGWEIKDTPTENNLQDISYSSPFNDVYYAVGDNQTIIVSTDNGITWSKVDYSGTNDFTAVFFYTQNIGFVAGNSGEFLRTLNAGDTWFERDALTEGNIINDIDFYSSPNAILVADNGIISYSTNSGNDWNSHNSPELNVDINNLSVISENFALACGDNGLIIKSTDGGENWSVIQQADKNYNLYGIDAKDENIWAAVSSDGRIFQTDNGGDSFTEVFSEAGEVINDVKYVGSSKFFAAGSNGKIYVSYNSGEDWSKQFSPTIENLKSIDFHSSNEIIIAGNSGTIVYTTDAGGNNSWDIEIYNPVSDAELIAGREYFIQWDAEGIDELDLFFSSDNGQNWELIDDNINADAATYLWDIPSDIESEQCLIKLADSDNENTYEISETFSIVENIIKITSPAEESVYKTGETITIEWNTNLDTEVELSYKINNSEISIGTASAQDKQFEWTAPDMFGKSISLNIFDVNDLLNNYSTDALITIWDFDFTAPVENEQLLTGRTYTIEWESNITEDVNIYYQSEENEPVLIATVKGTDLSYDWTPLASEIPDGNYKLIMAHPEIEEIAAETPQFEIFTKILEIASPEPGDIWNTFEDQTIEWTANFESTLKIEYLIDDEGETEIAQVNSLEGSYEWNVPDELNGAFYLKITDKDDELTYDEMEAFAYFNNRRIELLAPNGGEILNAGQQFNLRWESENIDEINILFSYDNGQSWNEEYSNILVTENPKIINIPNNPTSQCLIKIEDAEFGLASDMSDGAFSIYGILLDSFTEGETYLTNSEEEIVWTYLGSEYVNIYYSDDNGANWSAVEENYPAAQQPYIWEIPNNPGDDNRIKIIDTENSIYRDESSVNFTIKGLKITRPAGGELWASGSEETIEWESQSHDENVKIQYTTDDGTTWVTIDSYVDISLGSYTWNVPKNESGICRVKISTVNDSEIYDVSNEFFTIDGSGIVISRPNKDDIWETGNTYVINWGEAKVNTVDIYYSTDNGTNWQLIKSKHNKPPYLWEIPASVIPSTESYIKIIDTDNEQVYDISEKFRIKGKNLAYNVPVSWEHAKATGSNALIILNTSVANSIDDKKLSSGDAIGFFYEDGNEIKCGGYGIWQGKHLSVTVWGDNPMTTEKDGFSVEEDYIAKLWDGTEGKIHNIYAEYTTSNGGRFANDRVSYLSSLSIYNSLEIYLKGGVWSMISSNKLPADLSIDNLMTDVNPSFGEYGFMKDEDGLVYFPYEEINTIGNWNMSNGYQIYTEQDDTLEIKGIIPDLYTYRKSIEANKWHIVGFVPQFRIPVDIAVQSIDNYNNNNTNYTLIVKNDNGEIYYPNYGINQIGDMKPGEGYKVFSGISDVLQYPQYTPTKGSVIAGEEVLPPSYFVQPEIKSGNNAVIMIESDDMKSGDEVGIFDAAGNIIGSGVYNNERAVVTVWGDNPLSGKAKEGASYNEELEIRIYSAEDGKVKNAETLQITNLLSGTNIDGSLKYYEDAVLKADIEEGVINSVNDNLANSVTHYPNPANSFINIQANDAIKHIAIYDINGNRISASEVNDKNIRINLDDYSSGIYYYELTIDNKRIVNKFSVIK